jgi:hypothetical protein
MSGMTLQEFIGPIAGQRSTRLSRQHALKFSEARYFLHTEELTNLCERRTGKIVLRAHKRN